MRYAEPSLPRRMTGGQRNPSPKPRNEPDEGGGRAPSPLPNRERVPPGSRGPSNGGMRLTSGPPASPPPRVPPGPPGPLGGDWSGGAARFPSGPLGARGPPGASVSPGGGPPGPPPSRSRSRSRSRRMNRRRKSGSFCPRMSFPVESMINVRCCGNRRLRSASHTFKPGSPSFFSASVASR